MKAYRKPLLSISTLQQQENVSSLSNWLSQNELDGAGITTYVINS